MPNIHFVCGSGRCGTVSTTSLLKKQPNTTAAHESFLLPAIPNSQLFDKYTNSLNTINNVTNHFEIAFYLLYYTPFLIERFPTAKIACLHRDREETCQSFVNKSTNRHYWSVRKIWGSHQYVADSTWDRCFPNYELPKLDSIYKYLDDYYHRAEVLSKCFPLKIFEMDSVLNSESGQREFLEFFDIPNYQVNLRIQLNKGPK